MLICRNISNQSSFNHSYLLREVNLSGLHEPLKLRKVVEFGEPWKTIEIESYHFLLMGILKLISFEIDWEMFKILTLDSALPHLWKLKKSMGEKYRFQLFLCTKIMIKNSKFDNGTRFDNCLFLRLIITKFKFSWTAKSYNEDKFYSSLITSRVWTTRWLLLQRKSKMLSSDSKISVSDRILAEQPQFQQRLAAGVLLLFELFEHYFDLDLTKSIFQCFPPSGIQTEMISKKFSEFFYLKFLTIVRFCILPGNLYWFGRPAVHIQLLSHVVWAIPLTISCFSCSIYWPVWRNRWKEFPTIPTIVGIQLSSPLYNEMKIWTHKGKFCHPKVNLAQNFEKIFLGKVHLVQRSKLGTKLFRAKIFRANCTTGVW